MCFLVAPVSAFLVWKKRNAFRAVPFEPSRWGLALVLATTALTLALDLSGLRLYSLTPFIIVGILAGGIWAVYGFKVVRILSFPTLFLLFLLPVPPVIVFAIDYPLQEFGASVTTELVRLIGIPAYRAGANVYLPNFTMGVAWACNGVSSSFAMLALAVLLGYLSSGPPRGKVFLGLSAVPIAYVVNTLRLFVDAVVVNALGQKFLRFELYWDYAWGFLAFVLGTLALLRLRNWLKCGNFRPIT